MTPLADLIRRAWPVFREAARMGRTLTYSELAGRVGPPLTRRQIHRQLLTPLSALCQNAGLPDLSALVVRKDSGRPGSGYHGVAPPADPDRAWAEELAACWAFAWPAQPKNSLLEGLARSPEELSP